jgi:hypothetical protein
MGGKFPSRGDFTIPSAVFDEHEWMVDSLIDGEIGQSVTLYYPPKPTQCDNCKLDPETGLSSNIYNGGGPIPFTDFMKCPRCGGLGRLELPQTDTIDLRVYWNSSSWIDIGVRFESSEGVAMTIGYMVDLPKLEKATSLLVHANLEGVRRYLCEREGEAVPHGFRRKRYFIQYVKRIGGG